MAETIYEKNQIIELLIADLGSEGEGIGKIDGFPFFVKGAVPGDKIRASVMKCRKNMGYARLKEVLTPSPDRRTPECPVYGRCGGCQLMHLTYEAQLKYKEKKVRDALRRIGGIEEEVLSSVMEPILGMTREDRPLTSTDEDTSDKENGTGFVPLRYRNKAQYPFGHDREGNAVCGFYAGRTHSIIPQTDCLLGDQGNEEILKCILSWMRKYEIEAYDEVNGKGLLRHVLIRRGYHTGQIMVCLVINAKEFPHGGELCEDLSKIEGMHSISYSVNRKITNVIMGVNYHVLWGEPTIEDEIYECAYISESSSGEGTVIEVRKRLPDTGLRYRISPLSFYQVNSVQVERLYSTALEYAGLTGSEVIWDLYCGIGTISLFLARNAKKVYGVEIVSQAIEDARENAKRNGIENAEFFVGAAEEVLPKYYQNENDPEAKQPDVIVVDPPRKGCDVACLETMVRMQPSSIVYVSCDPATLARDVRYLRENGYELKRVRPCDMFANTYHVETVVLLSRV